MRHRLLLITLLFLLVPVGVATAQSSTSFLLQRSVIAGGATASSASYVVTNVVGDANTSSAASASYKVSGGFLFPFEEATANDEQLWLPLIQR